MLLATLVLLTLSSCLADDWCRGEFSCQTSSLLEQVHGVRTETECQELCSHSPGCEAYTLWLQTSLTHWEQCWLFSHCVATDCHFCLSGIEGEDCSSTTAVSTSPTSTVSGQDCPALTSDQEEFITCFPEFNPGEDVADGSHCIWSCGEDSSLHTCAGGVWDVSPPPGCFCPQLPQTEGQYLCVPDLLDSGEALDQTYCIFSCNDHPVADMTCQQGQWSLELSEVHCP